MATSKQTAFPIGLAEFVASIPKSKIESREAFAALMRKEGETGRKAPDQWQSLYELFRKQPTNVPWAQWVSQNKGGK